MPMIVARCAGMTARPIRLQLSRRKGFDLQACSHAANGLPAVNVARPSVWGNPYKVGDPKWDPTTGRRIGLLSAADVVEKYRRDCSPLRSAEIARLRGHNLACWCALGAPLCHADVLLELANGPTCAAASAGAAV